MTKYLDDIVNEDLPKGSRLKEELRLRLDNPVFRHPIISGAMFYVLTQYFRQKFPELEKDSFLQLNEFFSFYAGYAAYTITGLVKEYMLEGKNTKSKGVYSWFLNNPKISAAVASVIGCGVTIYGESRMADLTIALYDLGIKRGVQAGIFVEVASRGLKNIVRLKKGKKELEKNRKTSFAERVYNFAFEQPWILPAYVFINKFFEDYSSRTIHTIHHPVHEKFLSGRILTDLVEHPAVMASMAGQAVIDSVVALGGIMLLSSVLHTQSIRENSIRIARTYYRLTGKKEKALEFQKRLTDFPNSLERKIEDIVELGNMYASLGSREDAYYEYRRAIKLFDKKSDQIVYSDFFRKIPGISRLIRWYKKRSRRTEINEMFIDLLNKDKKALESIKKLVDNNQNNPNFLYIYGKALEILGYKESGRRQKEKAVKLTLESGINLQQIQGSKNTVVIFDEPLLKEEIVAKNASLEALEREKAATQRAKEILKDFDNFDVPTPLCIIKHNGLDYYVMEFASGDLLADRIREIKNEKLTVERSRKQEGLEDKLEEVAEFMGLLHARLRSDSQDERNSAEIIYDRLISVNIDIKTARTITENLYPALEAVRGIIRVGNKDTHSRNWILDEFGGITAIDLEEDRVVPLTYDTANLLDQHGRLEDEKKDRLFRKHIQSFRRYSTQRLEINEDQYKLAYLNSVIIRTLEAYAQLRKSKDIIFDALDNAENAVARIKQEYPEYYEKNSQAYQELEAGIKILKIS